MATGDYYEQTGTSFNELVRIVEVLRSENGCPWDRAQTHESIAKNMIEEAYEAVDAIEAGSTEHLCEELGDVLLQVVLHAEIARGSGSFTLQEVLQGITNKLTERHPHVFGTEASLAAAGFSAEERALIAAASTPADTLKLWDRIKLAEKARAADGVDGNTRAADGVDGNTRTTTTQDTTGVPKVSTEPKIIDTPSPAPPAPSLLDSIPTGEPALMQAQSISRKAVAQGFEWESAKGVFDKFTEEVGEFASAKPGSPHAEEEFGDILFTLVNIARWHDIDAETALRRTNRKFRARWAAMEQIAAQENLALSTLSAKEWDTLWERVKQETHSEEAHSGEPI